MSLARPSYGSGFARGPGASAYPHLWRGLSGAWHMGIGATGDTVFDLSGKGRHGTRKGSSDRTTEFPDWEARPSGYVLNLAPQIGSGAEAHVELPLWTNTTGKMTIVAKAKRTLSSVGDTRIFSRALSTGDHDWMLGNVSDGTLRTRFKDGTTTHTSTTTLIWGVGRLRFVAGVYTGTQVNHYHFANDTNVADRLPIVSNLAIGGTFAAETLANSGSMAINIGRNPGATPYGNWGGDIHCVYVYDRVLTTGELTQLFLDDRAPFRLRRRVYKPPAAAVGGGLSIPIAMHNYRRRRA